MYQYLSVFFSVSLPTEASIISTAETPNLETHVQPPKIQALSPPPVRHRSPSPFAGVNAQSRSFGALANSIPPQNHITVPLKPPNHTDSSTESEAEEAPIPDKGKARAASGMHSSMHGAVKSPKHAGPLPSQPVSPLPPPNSKQASVSKAPVSDSESSPPRPAKKAKTPRLSSSDEDSEEERKRRVAQLKSGAGGGVKRGTRQPIKRGGKRF